MGSSLISISGFSPVRENLENLEKRLIFEKVRENLEKSGNFVNFSRKSGKSQGNFFTMLHIFIAEITVLQKDENKFPVSVNDAYNKYNILN